MRLVCRWLSLWSSMEVEIASFWHTTEHFKDSEIRLVVTLSFVMVKFRFGNLWSVFVELFVKISFNLWCYLFIFYLNIRFLILNSLRLSIFLKIYCSYCYFDAVFSHSVFNWENFQIVFALKYDFCVKITYVFHNWIKIRVDYFVSIL